MNYLSLMNTERRAFRFPGWLALAAFTGLTVSWSAQLIQAAAITWDGLGGDDFWSTDNNWSDNLPPAGDDVTFDATDTVGNSVTINNIVSATDSINTLAYRNTGTSWHNTQINNGITLNVGGSTNDVMTVGANVASSTTNVTISGMGALNVSRAAGNVLIDGYTAGGIGNAVMFDMSGLAQFDAALTTGKFRIGNITGATASNVQSTVKLAATSTITAGRVEIGATTFNTGTQTLKLGSATQTINADMIDIGSAGTGTGRGSGEISFNSVTGTLHVRATDTTSAATMNVVNTTQPTGTALSGTVNLLGHSSNLLLSTLTIASRTGSSGAFGSTGTFSFDTGLLSVSNVVLATKTGGGTGTSTGTINIGGGTANFGAIAMASATSGQTANATVNLTGGATTVAGDITKTGGAGTTTATINLDGGTLDMTNGNIGAANVVVLAAKSGTLQNLAQLNSGGTLTKTTGGLLILAGANTYTGQTSITTGTLQVNGTHTNAGAYGVTGTGILGGLGTITTASNAGITFAAGTKLAPGTSPGTLTANLGTGTANISGAITAVNSASMLFDLDTTTTSDRLLLSNALSTLTIGSGLLEFNDFVFTTTGSFAPGEYKLFDTGNSISGAFGSSLSGTVGGYLATIEFRNGTQDIVLNVVPEPSTFAMLLFGTVMLWFVGKKRNV